MTEKPVKQYGDIEFQGKDIQLTSQKFDKIAVSGRGELLLLSVVAPTQITKAMRAILNGGAKAQITAGGVKVQRPTDEPYYARQPGRLYATPDGYNTYNHKLGYGLAHTYFITRMPGFLRVVSEEALWQELNDTRFTTPLLREWMPYIEKQLREAEVLEDAHSYGCRCGVLSSTTKRLDEIVSEGIKSHKLLIPSTAEPLHAVA